MTVTTRVGSLTVVATPLGNADDLSPRAAETLRNASVIVAEDTRSARRLLAALGTERDREQLVALLDRLDAVQLRVPVADEAKRGKSTLVNALLGRGAAVRSDTGQQ